MNIESLGDRVKKARKHAGFTQVQLAKKVETSQGAISDIENGRNKESSSLFDIAKVTGVSADWLINNQGEMLDVPKKPSIKELEAQINELQGQNDSDLYTLPINTKRISERALFPTEKRQVNSPNSNARLLSESKPSISYGEALDTKERMVSSIASNYALTPSNPSVVELIDSLKDLERQNKLTPELVALLNTTIETFKKILEEAKNEQS